eukprot:5637999-Amphidinium_carterae.1
MCSCSCRYAASSLLHIAGRLPVGCAEQLSRIYMLLCSQDCQGDLKEKIELEFSDFTEVWGPPKSITNAPVIQLEQDHRCRKVRKWRSMSRCRGTCKCLDTLLKSSPKHKGAWMVLTHCILS